MLGGKAVSCLATADASQQIQMLSRKRRCYMAKPFPV